MNYKDRLLSFPSAMGLLSLTFLLDLMSPAGVQVSFLYMGVILSGALISKRNASFWLAVLASLMVTVAYFFRPADISESASKINLLFALVGIWATFALVIAFRKREISASKYRDRLDALFTYATEGMLITDSRGEIVMVNAMACQQFGYEPGELNGKKIEVLIPERVSESHIKKREQYNRSPKPRPMGAGLMLSARKKDGSEFPVEISLSNYSTREGKFVIAFIIDITERRKAEELVRKEKELAQRYLDIAPVIITVVNSSGKITLVNQKGCQIFNKSETEIIGKDWFEFFIPAQKRDQIRLEFFDMLSGTKPLSEQFEQPVSNSKNESRIIQWKNIFIRNEKGEPVSVLFSGEDITERKIHEQTIAELNRDLEQRVKIRTEELAETVSQLEKTNSYLAREINERTAIEERLKASREELQNALSKEKELSELKSRFVTMASHEFRTPLSTILSSATLAEKYTDPGQTEKRNKHFSRIKSSVNNLTGILNDFLSLGKLEEGKVGCNPELLDLQELGDDIVNELQGILKSGQSITKQFALTGDTFFQDKKLIHNIAINLLSNAIKYSEEASEIIFRLIQENGILTMEVTDHGIGIPHSEQPHLFERFFRANNAINIQGTGLGLNIVKKYTELMQGKITFESTPGEQTTFRVDLPEAAKN